MPNLLNFLDRQMTTQNEEYFQRQNNTRSTEMTTIRDLARNLLSNPRVNHSLIRETLDSLSEDYQHSDSENQRQSSEDDYEKFKALIEKRQKANQKRREEMMQFKEAVFMEKGHPSWTQEVIDSLTMPSLDKVRIISKEFGILGMLIFVRLLSVFQKMQNSN